jgi:glyoxylase-like metal-dependent hydrolase (beta-lactamase superfamily II)
MRHSPIISAGIVVLTGLALVPAQAASLQEAANLLGATSAKSLEFSGSGHWWQFGQAPNPTAAWPQFDVSAYSAAVNFDAAAEHVQLTRLQTIEPGRTRPAPTEQKVDAYLSGDKAWNVAPPQNSPAGTAPVATPQPAAIEERAAEIWSTPQGFLKAALANGAKSEAKGASVEVSFTLGGKYRYVGSIDANNQLEWVKTWIDTPVLGDTPIETRFSGYKDFAGLRFPAEIHRSEGGYPVLHLNIAAAKANGAPDIAVPANVASFQPTAPTVKADKLAEGVYWLTGGTHHSVLVEQKDHVVLVEAPLNEERSLALIKKIGELAPNKPIRYVVNSHVHFDHSGGLRTLVDAGAIVVTHELGKAYYEKIWSAPHTLRADNLAKSAKPAKFETFTDKTVLTDGARRIEIHHIAGSGHADDLALVYLPAEKILVEADAYTPAAADAPPPKTPNPYSVNLYENIEKLGLQVTQIAGLHGPRVATLADLRAAIGKTALAQ